MEKTETSLNQTQTKNEIKNLVDWFLRNYGSLRTSKLLDKLKLLGFKNSTLSGISLGLNDLSIPIMKPTLFKNSELALKKNKIVFKKGYISEIPYIEKVLKIWNETNENLKDEILKNFRESNIMNPLLIMTLSGARGNISQVKQLVGMRGLMADSQGEIIDLPIKNNFKEGLNLTEYFISCYGARKGLIDTALKTANSGYLTRRLIFVVQNQRITQPNCKTPYKRALLNLKQNKEKYNLSKHNLIGRVLAKDIYFKNSLKILAGAGQDICHYLANKILKAKKIYIRSPLTCQLNSGICQLCYGWNLGSGRLAELGESIGIIAAQSIGEPGTQLTMRTFHTGGVFSGQVKKTFNAPHEGKIFFKKSPEERKVTNKYGEIIIITKQPKIVTVQENNMSISKIQLPINSLLFVKPNQKVYYKQIIAEIKNKKSFLHQKTDVREILSPLSGLIFISQRQKKNILFIISHSLFAYNSFYRTYKKPIPWLSVVNDEYEKLKKFSLTPKKKKVFLLNMNYFKTNPLKKIKTKKKKTLDFFYTIQENIQEQNEFVTNKKLTDKYLKKQKIRRKVGICKKFWLQNYSSLIIQKRNLKTFLIRKVSNTAAFNKAKIENKNKTIKKNKILYYRKYTKEKNQDIVQGLPKIDRLFETRKTSDFDNFGNNPHERLQKIFDQLEKVYPNNVAVRISLEKIQEYLVTKIQNVYKAQGVIISNKHIELIIKQITSKVIIKDQGQTPILPGEIIELNKIEKLNQKIEGKASYEPILQGISKLSLTSKSFISAASFQETAKILSRAAIEGKVDWLYGLKENIIFNKLIPVGTGYKIKKIN